VVVVCADAARRHAVQRVARQAAVEAVGLGCVEVVPQRILGGLERVHQVRVTMSSTGVGGRCPTVCSIPAIQNG
jgi:hypothetical protein